MAAENDPPAHHESGSAGNRSRAASGSASAVLDPDPELDRVSPPPPPNQFDDEPAPLPAGDALHPPVSNARLAMLAFIVFESMLFAGLLGGYVILRWGSEVWPPPGQPYLPIGVTWLNTAVLLASCLPLALSRRAFRLGDRPRFVKGLMAAALLGTVFLCVQGFEWMKLLAHGMTVSRGVYGASFLILIGTHALHVLAAVAWLLGLAVVGAAGRIGPKRQAALDICAMYWYFVCAVWIVLFSLVYVA